MSNDTNTGTEGTEGGDAGGTGGEGGGGAEMPTWMSSMPDAYKQNEGFAKFGEASDAYAKFDELLKAEGGALTIPGEDASDEDKNAFAMKMGRPETAEGYEIGKPQDWPEGVQYDEALDGQFKEAAFQMGLSGEKANALHGWYNNLVLDAHNAEVQVEKAAMEKAENELKTAWPGDAHKVNSEMAHRAFKQFGGESEAEQKEAHDFINNTIVDGVLLGEHPMFLKQFHRIAKLTSDDNANSGMNNPSGELSEEQKDQKRFPNTKFKT
ncbi:hypothetical protein KAR91_41980 [Candidatus Pacearchaeota archaeon]|nr:hypothetical protein [Candidatus Pacearchaeota archaeon]